MGDIFMWIILGLVAIVFMVLNIVIRNQHGWLGYISLAFTALTVCAFYQNAANLETGCVYKSTGFPLCSIMP